MWVCRINRKQVFMQEKISSDKVCSRFTLWGIICSSWVFSFFWCVFFWNFLGRFFLEEWSIIVYQTLYLFGLLNSLVAATIEYINSYEDYVIYVSVFLFWMVCSSACFISAFYTFLLKRQKNIKTAILHFFVGIFLSFLSACNLTASADSYRNFCIEQAFSNLYDEAKADKN